MKISKLQEPAFRLFPTSSISPEGWLKNQLKTQLDGLSGNLDLFWPDIKDSAWIGGEAEGWERMPYWLDGVIPLAWLLDDEPFKKRISGYMDKIFAGQHESGWLGPLPEEKVEALDLWSQALATKVLYVWRLTTNDPRVDDALLRAFRCLDRYLDKKTLSQWGATRWQEFLIALYDLYERHPEPFLLSLAKRFQAQGFDWVDYFNDWPNTEPTEPKRWSFENHVVNNGQALKTGPLWWRISGLDSDLNAASHMYSELMCYHGMPSGIFTGDENLSGRSTSQGTELCAVCETMYSMEVNAAITGDSMWGDVLEKVTFNALPATFSPDMWAHQYDQQINQIECSIHARPWTTNGSHANLFGLEPNFGCCTANLSQGWPKFAASTWMDFSDPEAGEGFVAVAYAPSAVRAVRNGVNVRAAMDTEYPFRDSVRFVFDISGKASFPFKFRIPGWCKNASIVEADGSVTSCMVSGEYLTRIIATDGPATITITLNLPAEGKWVANGDGSTSLCRGPLLFALKMAERWEICDEGKPYREHPHCDYTVFPESKWNYAVMRSSFTSLPAMDGVVFENRPLPESSTSFAPDAAPVVASVPVAEVPSWVATEYGNVGEMPLSPVVDTGANATVEFIPYGCTNLRVGALPWCQSPDSGEPWERPLILAHRGGRDEYDDNAVGGFVDSLKHGIRGAETDIRMTADGELVVMHDAKADRTTTGTGIVEEMTFDEVKALTLRRSGEHVPSAKEVFEVYRGRKDVAVEIEMKTFGDFYTPENLERYCKKLYETAASILEPNTYAFTSFSHDALATMRRLYPAARLGLIMGGAMTEEKLQEAIGLGCALIAPEHETTKEMVDRAHAAGILVNLWCSDTIEVYRDVKAKGADFSTSNVPRKILPMCL